LELAIAFNLISSSNSILYVQFEDLYEKEIE